MPRLRQNDHERAVGIVQTGITRQVVADHFNVSRITISRLMIRLRQTGRTNDRPRNDRPRVTSQYQDRHLRLIHLRYRMITTEDTARRTPGLSNIRISGQNVRRTPRQSGLRARRPAVGPVLKQRHRTARLAWAHARVIGGFTPGNTSFLVINPDFHFVLAMDVIVCTAGVGNVLRTSVCTSPTVLETEVLCVFV
jgi:transposase